LQVKPSPGVLIINAIYVINYRELYYKKRREVVKTYLEEVKE